MKMAMEKMVEAMLRVLCDIRPPAPADAAYLFAQTKDNEFSVLHAAAEIVAGGLARRIFLLQGEPNNGYSGFQAWKTKLLALGISEKQMCSIELGQGELHNTKTEAFALVRFAKRCGLKTLVVSSPPFHQLRAFMSVVTASIADCPGIGIYSYPGKSLPWMEQVVHSQGILTATRAALIVAELERIHAYYRKGDLISFDDVIEYLQYRDKSMVP
jgi:hypothetical protein